MTLVRPHKRKRQHIEIGQESVSVTSDDPLKLGGHCVEFEVQVIMYIQSDETNHQKTKTGLGINPKQSSFLSSFSQLSAYSSSPAHSHCQSQSQPRAHKYSDLGSDKKSFESTQYLWDKASQRTPAHFTSEHEPVVAITQSYLKVWIISGHAGPESMPWPDSNKQWLSDKMGVAWTKMARNLGDRPGFKWPGVDDKLTEAEACKVIYVLIVAWYYANSLSSMTHSVNSVSIPWPELGHWYWIVMIGSCSQHKILWRCMLKNFCRMTTSLVMRYVEVQHNPSKLTTVKSPKTRFCTWIILSVLANTVFGKCNHLTFETHTAALFDSLLANPVLFVVTMIAHCIQEYETEEYIKEQFDDLRVLSNSSSRIKIELC